MAKATDFKIDAGTLNEEVRIVSSVAIMNPPSPDPNVPLTEALPARPSARGAGLRGTTQSGVGFQPDYDTEWKHEAPEFAAGTTACSSRRSSTRGTRHRPSWTAPGPTRSSTPIETTFVFVNELRHPLHDGRLEAHGELHPVGCDGPA